jgi:hypothetical protein
MKEEKMIPLPSIGPCGNRFEGSNKIMMDKY